MCKKFEIVSVLFGCLLIGVAQANIAAFDMELHDLLKMQKGYGWPYELTVVVGHEALLKLTTTVENQEQCTVTTPAGETFSASSPPSNRYQHWDGECGIRIRQVQSSDYGRWRLTSSAANASITGWTEVYVEDDTSVYVAPPLSLQDGQAAQLDLTSLDNEYCVVAQPFAQSSLLSGHCRVNLERATRAVQGNWNILVGLPGRVSELHVDRRVIVQAERLDVGYIHDTAANKIHLYCNIQHTVKNITFCRFQRTNDVSGYNVMEGLSDGSYSYYGDGFIAKHCGMTIESPAPRDYSTWRCSVGSQLLEGTTPIVQPIMQALINVPSHSNAAGTIQRDLRNDANEVRSIFVQLDVPFTITCNAEVSLSYCWFQHPDGSQYSPVAQTSEDQLFWYTGESLQTGDCGITFTHARSSDAGDWVCHMGATNLLGVELTDRVNVRVTGPLAAHMKEIGVTVGESTTIHCHTSNGNKPLDYCRFLNPNLVGFSLDESVTAENSILGRYHFTPDRFLDHGDCSLTITSVQAEDIGEWTCAGLINTEFVEASDTILLHTGTYSEDSRQPLSRASIIGMAAGVSMLVVMLGGVVWYKYGTPLPIRFRRTRKPSSQQSLGDLSFNMMSLRSGWGNRSSVSNNSTISGSSITVGDLPEPNELVEPRIEASVSNRT